LQGLNSLRIPQEDSCEKPAHYSAAPVSEVLEELYAPVLEI